MTDDHEYEYASLEELLQALNDEISVRTDEIAPALLGKPVWIGLVSLAGGYVPHAYVYAARRADAVAGLRGLGAPAGLGRSGLASVTRRGILYELDEARVGDLFL
jgi:hypothetical protein